MARMVLFASIILLCVLSAYAQEQQPRFETRVYVGEGDMHGKEGTYGKGAEAGLSIEFRPFRRVGFMAGVNRLNHSGTIIEPNGAKEWWDISGTAVQMSGSAVYHFTGVPLEPYVFGGGGALRASRTTYIKKDFVISNPTGCLFGCGPTPIPTNFSQTQFKGTNAAGLVGAGLRIPLAWRFSFQPEVQFVGAGNVHLLHAVFALGYRQ